MPDDVLGQIAQGVQTPDYAGAMTDAWKGSIGMAQGLQQLQTGQFNLQTAQLNRAYSMFAPYLGRPNPTMDDVYNGVANVARQGLPTDAINHEIAALLQQGYEPREILRTLAEHSMPSEDVARGSVHQGTITSPEGTTVYTTPGPLAANPYGYQVQRGWYPAGPSPAEAHGQVEYDEPATVDANGNVLTFRHVGAPRSATPLAIPTHQGRNEIGQPTGGAGAASPTFGNGHYGQPGGAPVYPANPAAVPPGYQPPATGGGAAAPAAPAPPAVPGAPAAPAVPAAPAAPPPAAPAAPGVFPSGGGTLFGPNFGPQGAAAPVPPAPPAVAANAPRAVPSTPGTILLNPPQGQPTLLEKNQAAYTEDKTTAAREINALNIGRAAYDALKLTQATGPSTGWWNHFYAWEQAHGVDLKDAEDPADPTAAYQRAKKDLLNWAQINGSNAVQSDLGLGTNLASNPNVDEMVKGATMQTLLEGMGRMRQHLAMTNAAPAGGADHLNYRDKYLGETDPNGFVMNMYSPAMQAAILKRAGDPNGPAYQKLMRAMWRAKIATMDEPTEPP